MIDFEEIFQSNKDEILAIANSNTHLNKDGLATISRDDEWFYDDVWDEDIKRCRDAAADKRHIEGKVYTAASGLVG